LKSEHGSSSKPCQTTPGDFHIELVRIGAFIANNIHQQPPENSCRPAVDVLFRSAASAVGSGCLAVVLTGMGQDGLRGGRDIIWILGLS
jgi:two-component system chemotaxis response regulator CheB